PRDHVDFAAVRTFPALPIVPRQRPADLRRIGDQTLVMGDERRSGGRPLEIRSVAGGTLAQALDAGTGPDDVRYVISEEIVATAPALQVRVFVRRYGRTGQLTGLVHVPLDGMEVVPHNFIAIADGGKVRVLAPTASGVRIREYEFTAPPRAGGAG